MIFEIFPTEIEKKNVVEQGRISNKKNCQRFEILWDFFYFSRFINSLRFFHLFN